MTEQDFKNSQLKYENELKKLQDDPEHYVTPGAKRYFRRVSIGYVILAFAIVAGLLAQQRETGNRVESINESRAIVTYVGCLDQNNRHDKTIERLDALLEKRTNQIRANLIQASPTEAIALRGELDRIRASRDSTITLIEALAPHQSCKQIVIDRFGSVPEVK